MHIKQDIDEIRICGINQSRAELKEIEQLEQDDIQEIETINRFADGRLVQTITNYKYKENYKENKTHEKEIKLYQEIEKEDNKNTCPPIIPELRPWY